MSAFIYDGLRTAFGRHAGSLSSVRPDDLLAGLPVETGGLTVNRLCGSGLAAIIDASRAVRCGEGDLFIAGGAESMSRAPFVMAKGETPFSRDFRAFDSTIGARFPNPLIERTFGADTMPETAENIAREFDLSREHTDLFAAQSQARYEDEILAIDVPQGRKKPPATIREDEHPRPNRVGSHCRRCAKNNGLGPSASLREGFNPRQPDPQ